MSEEAIKILDTLANEFGLTINWTSENVLLYLQQLCSKYITYAICTNIVWILVGVCLILVGKYLAKKANHYWQEYKNDKDSGCDIVTGLFEVLAGCIAVVGSIIIVHQILNIVTYIAFPERVIIEELKLICTSLR